MATAKKSVQEKIQSKQEELAKVEAKIKHDTERKRQLKADISELETQMLQQAIRESGLTLEEAAAVLSKNTL